ncbi:CAP domain-containing protein [Neobacillus sp. PS3-40]|uniref:CAP domain-containing protein n=1 Tax=Neobacillus sp. PS3-40 TaxID=3070679 RepID=UPI0027DF582B|nr:CAP domain-containing protein [Neobacillus sp. PS3-40]WML44140.1 CAP domain-containing protein [Neobacillus sp. PS3-40]
MNYKKTKLAIASTLLISLGACAQKNAGDQFGPRNVNNPRNVSTGDLNGRYVGPQDYSLNGQRNVGTRDYDLNRTRNMSTRDLDLTRPRNVSTGDLKYPMQNMNVSDHNSTTEIQPMNNGFITIDQNSYSTSMASHQFPHSKKIQQGNFWYYSFQPEVVKQRTGMIPQQPKNGVVTPPTTRGQAAPAPTQAPTEIGKVALQVIELTNVERKKNGLPPLKADASLSKVAQTKSNDMETKHYFSHTSPTYGSPFDMMRDFGVTYRTAGENIAMGQPTAQEVVNAWMNSEGHRKNILSANYTNIGVGYTQAGNYWSQMFIGK